MKKSITALLLGLVFMLPTLVHAGMRMTLYSLSVEQVEVLKKDPSKIIVLALSRDPAITLDIDKDWHGIHYILTEKAGPTKSPPSNAIFGGTEIGADLGYGPARLLTPAEVKTIATALAAETKVKVETRYNARKMDALNIYPEIWSRDGKQAHDELMETYARFSAFYQKAASTGNYVLLIIS